MEKVEIEVGSKYGTRVKTRFTGVEVTSRTELYDPGHDSRGLRQVLYKVPKGWRVVEIEWSRRVVEIEGFHWKGEEGENQTSISQLLPTEASLMYHYPELATKAGIMEVEELD